MWNTMKYLSNVVTLRYFPEKCTGCWRCVEVCPRGVFHKNEKEAEITDKDLCLECGACAQNCRYGAIYVEPGVGCAAAVIDGLISGGEPECGCSSSDKEAGC